MRFVKVLLLLVVFVFGLLFFAQNGTELGFVQEPQKIAASQDGAADSAAVAKPSGKNLTLQFDLYFKNLKWQSAAIPLYVVILCSFAVGMLFATVLLFIDRIRLGCSLMGRKRAVRNLEREVERLRAELAKEAKVIAAKSTEIKELPQTATAK